MTVAGQATRDGRDGGAGAPARHRSPAQAIGLQAGDRIVAIDGDAGQRRRDRADDRRLGAARSSTLTVVRNGKRADSSDRSRPSSSTTAIDSASASTGTGLGLRSRVRPRGEGDGIVSKEIVKSLGRLVTGRGATRSRARSASRGRPRTRSSAGADSYLWVLGLISLSLALLNLLPLLPLDGGHILFTLDRGRARPLPAPRDLRARLDGRPRARPAALLRRPLERHRQAVVVARALPSRRGERGADPRRRRAHRRRRARRRAVDDADEDARRARDDGADRGARVRGVRDRARRGAEERGRRRAARSSCASRRFPSSRTSTSTRRSR